MENSTEEIGLKCNMSGSHDFIFTLIPVVYGCNFVIGIVGNSMVVAVIYCYMKLKTAANIFVLNLAVSDLTFLITLPMWATVTATGYHWPFGSFLCKATASLVIFNLYTSVFFLTSLSIDRYLALVHPMRSRQCRTVANARIACVVIWGFSFLLSVPTDSDEVLRMLAAVVLAFFLCWVPHQIFHFMDVLALFNSCMNPILYGFVGKNFRKNLLKLLRGSPPTVATHASLTAKMSMFSYRASESLHLTANRTTSLPDVK